MIALLRIPDAVTSYILRQLVFGRSWTSFFALDDNHGNHWITRKHRRLGFAVAGADDSGGYYVLQQKLQAEADSWF